MARTTSCCVMSRPRPRRLPSTSRRYRNFSPSVILQIAITVFQFAISVKRNREIICHCFSMAYEVKTERGGVAECPTNEERPQLKKPGAAQETKLDAPTKT